MTTYKILEEKFINLKNANPYWSSYTCYAVAVMFQWYDWKVIKTWFNQFVYTDDYAKKDKYKILQFLGKYSEYREEDMYWNKVKQYN